MVESVLISEVRVRAGTAAARSEALDRGLCYILPSLLSEHLSTSLMLSLLMGNTMITIELTS